MHAAGAILGKVNHPWEKFATSPWVSDCCCALPLGGALAHTAPPVLNSPHSAAAQPAARPAAVPASTRRCPVLGPVPAGP